MKNFLLLLMVAFVAVFGMGIKDCGTPKIPPELCSEYDAGTSLLLKVSSARNIPLNEIYYGLLDSTQIGMIFEVLERQKVADFMNDLADWYIEHYPVSYTTLIEYMTDQAKARGLVAIMNRRIGMYQSDLIISQYDDCLLRAGWGKAMDELFLR